MEEIKQHNDKLQKADVISTARKHWLFLILPFILILFGLVLLNFTIWWKLAGVVLILFQGAKVLSLLSVRWTLTAHNLIITSGFLPWKKVYLQVPVFDIYEAYMTYGTLGHFLNYGNIFIRRTEGSTSQLSSANMASVRKFQEQVNKVVQEYKVRKNTINLGHIQESITKALKELCALKSGGMISDEEFSLLKRKIINGSND